MSAGAKYSKEAEKGTWVGRGQMTILKRSSVKTSLGI